MKLV
ncbi:hypothetical protein VTN00DRAFT_961 [Thermoascus crustaceus]|jgi:hypothetical protein